MRVFVAGATGVIGRRLVPALMRAGHHVTGMTRSEDRAAELRTAGAEAVVCDAFDSAAVAAAMGAAAPEVVVHQLTSLPQSYDMRSLKEAYARNDAIRRTGTRALVDGAVASGARRIVAQSVAFLYAPEGSAVKAEDARPFIEAPEPFAGSVAAALELEVLVTGTAGLEGLALRYGFFYGPGTYYAREGSIAALVRARRFPIVGRGGGVFSFVHVDDAVAATVAALDRGATGIYNVVDDDPAPMRDWLPVYADALGARRPLRVPRLLGRLAAGALAVSMATELRGASNARAKRELGWVPRYASWRQGFRDGLG